MPDVEPIAKGTALAIHDAAIARFGGAAGLRDDGLLDAALAQPWQTFGGEDLYPAVEEKAAPLAYEVISQHLFVDGNKRTAAALMRALLVGNGLASKPRWQDWFDIIFAVGPGESDYGDLLEFVWANTVSDQ